MKNIVITNIHVPQAYVTSADFWLSFQGSLVSNYLAFQSFDFETIPEECFTY